MILLDNIFYIMVSKNKKNILDIYLELLPFSGRIYMLITNLNAKEAI